MPTNIASLNLPIDPRLYGWVYNTLVYSATSVTPHAATLRATYQPSSGRIGYIRMAALNLVRRSAASTMGVAVGYVTLNSTSYGERIVEVLHDSNTANSARYLSTPLNLYVTPNDIVRIYTYDPSTGGSFDYTITILYLEGLL